MNTTDAVTVLYISPVIEDYASLKHILRRSELPGLRGSNYDVRSVVTLEVALRLLRTQCIPVVICEQNLSRGTWKHVFAELQNLPEQPLLIITARLADECLWAEVLNYGAYDVLAKPFDAEEVIRVVGMARIHWNERNANQRYECCDTAARLASASFASGE